MKEKYLPIGTVVTLNGGTKKVMIIGYCPPCKLIPSLILWTIKKYKVKTDPKLI